ncbi:hypothetical protein JCM3766R1_004569 [Sporobolomyces carnicolor]
MVRYSGTISVLLGTALAVLATDASEPRIDKRQSSGPAVSNLELLKDVLQNATLSTSTNGECSGECSPWVSSVSNCNLENYIDANVCACGDTLLTAMNTCGSCLGSSTEDEVASYTSFCQYFLPTSTSSMSSQASTSSASSSSSTSPTGAESTSHASSTTATTTNGNSSPVSSAASQSAPSQSPGSGAGTVKVGMGVLAGALGIALMA